MLFFCFHQHNSFLPIQNSISLTFTWFSGFPESDDWNRVVNSSAGRNEYYTKMAQQIHHNLDVWLLLCEKNDLVQTLPLNSPWGGTPPPPVLDLCNRGRQICVSAILEVLEAQKGPKKGVLETKREPKGRFGGQKGPKGTKMEPKGTQNEAKTGPQHASAKKSIWGPQKFRPYWVFP